ncbi:MAG: CapA family protein [Spirochaetaceae bacterium]|jgi:poly-gamma-glutamate synthesis protein (capsule biosynthesis protein)|nr:CapA family protein [Spirochaetaceae bacterium]
MGLRNFIIINNLYYTSVQRFCAVFFRLGLIYAAAFIFFACATENVSRAGSWRDTVITMVGTGDNLIHKELIDYAGLGNDKFNFDQCYSQIRNVVKASDVAFVNQETMIAGKEFRYSGYPLFNGPSAVGTALVNTGFNVVNHATNHAMDKGADAVLATINFWKSQKNIMLIGIYESQKVRDVKHIINVKGIKIGFLAYTYGLNGLSLPEDKPYLVSLIDTNVMAQEIDALRPYCDFLAVSMHWGNEYEYTPSKRQQELAAFLAEHNVDLVIGHHPHVLQPVKWLPKASGGMMLCYFSLGNFLSAQTESPRLLGGMMHIKIRKKSKSGMILIENAELLPLVTHYTSGYKDFKIYFLDDYTQITAASHALNIKGDKITLDYFRKLITSIFGEKSTP